MDARRIDDIGQTVRLLKGYAGEAANSWHANRDKAKLDAVLKDMDILIKTLLGR